MRLMCERAKQKTTQKSKTALRHPPQTACMEKRGAPTGQPNKYAPPGPGVAHSLMTVPPPLNLEDTATSWKPPDIEGGAVTCQIGLLH